MRDKVAQEKKAGLRSGEAVVRSSVAQKAAQAKQQSRATRDTLVKMKQLEVQAKQNWVLRAKAERAGSEFEKFEQRELRQQRERELSEQRTREALLARDALARELADLERQEKAALSGLNVSVCQKNRVLNEVVDLMNRKVDKHELALLQQELLAANKQAPPAKNLAAKDRALPRPARASLHSPTKKRPAPTVRDSLDSSAVLLESPNKAGKPRLARSAASVTRSLKVLQPSRILEQIERQRSAALIQPRKPRQPSQISTVPEDDREKDLETPQKARRADSGARQANAGSAAGHLLTEKAALKQDLKLRDLKSLAEFDASETPRKPAGKLREKSASGTPHHTPRPAKSLAGSSKKLVCSTRPGAGELYRQGSPPGSELATPRAVKLVWNPAPRKAVFESMASAEPLVLQDSCRAQEASLQQASSDEKTAGFSGCKNFDFEFMTEE